MSGITQVWPLLLAPLPLVYLLLIRRNPGLPLPLDLWQGGPAPGAPSGPRLAFALSGLAYATAWLLLVLSLAGPYRLVASPRPEGRSAEIIVAFDVSPSMAALDLAPNRMAAAQDLMRAFVDARPDASLGLVAFGAEAALVCPPTPDHASFLERLDQLRAGLFGQGTALGIGLANAFTHLRQSVSPVRIILLVSDGEDNMGQVHPADIARQCQALGIGMLVVGVGTRGMVQIDYTDPYSGEQRRGVYESDFNETALRDLARLAGGQYFAVEEAASLARVASQLRGLDGLRFDPLGNSSRESLAGWFLGLACLSVLGAWLIRNLWLGGVA